MLPFILIWSPFQATTKHSRFNNAIYPRIVSAFAPGSCIPQLKIQEVAFATEPVTQMYPLSERIVTSVRVIAHLFETSLLKKRAQKEEFENTRRASTNN